LFRLSRSNFLALIHRHPTLVLQLLSKQHSRLRQQRADARHFY
jgi:CRP-like cAMP-binding protein